MTVFCKSTKCWLSNFCYTFAFQERKITLGAVMQFRQALTFMKRKYPFLPGESSSAGLPNGRVLSHRLCLVAHFAAYSTRFILLSSIWSCEFILSFASTFNGWFFFRVSFRSCCISLQRLCCTATRRIPGKDVSSPLKLFTTVLCYAHQIGK